MSDRDSARYPRVVVCGTRFGRVYLAAFRARDFPFKLAGILARGSERSRACAQHYGVPLFTDPNELPSDVKIACVVVGTSVIGGAGGELAQALMARGIHVLQEHPLHHDELATCLRQARRYGVVYHLNPFYSHLTPIRRFICAARELFRRQRPVFVDAACSVLVSYSLFDILGQALGSLRPWAFREFPPLPVSLRTLSDIVPPFRSMDGFIAGVPFTLRIQNQVHPRDPDSHAHFLHRITLGTEGGTLTLVNTHGPVIWSPRPNMPRAAEESIALEEVSADYLQFPSATPLGQAEARSYREILGSVWPAGVRRALLALHRAVSNGEDPLRQGQYHLTLCRLWQDATARLGYPEILDVDSPRPLPAEVLLEAVKGEDYEDVVA